MRSAKLNARPIATEKATIQMFLLILIVVHFLVVFRTLINFYSRNLSEVFLFFLLQSALDIRIKNNIKIIKDREHISFKTIDQK
jgi:hypothetical protein